MKKILDVGQCDFDHGNITRALTKNFEVEVHRASTHEQAVELAGKTSFDLILVNRLLDANGNSGMDVVESLKSNPDTNSMPVMIVSNFEDAQEKAVAAGAVRGFGKTALTASETIELLKNYL